ncbi:MAG: hypothetical protein AAB441_01640 [Patescibacteria group bacterium]
MKNHKGEIATFLTLGLVIVGTLITLGTSFFVNKTKIASNPKAGGTYKLCCREYACGKYGAKETQKKVIAVGFEGVNSSGTVGYTSCDNTGYSNTTYCSKFSPAPTENGGFAFVACTGGGNNTESGCVYSSPKFCKDNANCSADCTECTSGKWKCPNNTNSSENVPEGCKPTNCKAKFPNNKNFLNTTLISTNKAGKAAFYKSENCDETTKVDLLNDLFQYCSGESASQSEMTCIPDQSCAADYTNGNENQYAYSIVGSVTTYYKGASCYGTPKATNVADIKTYCTTIPPDPDAEANAECNPDVSCSTISSTNTEAMISSKDINGVIYYYKNTNCGGTKVDEAKALTHCNSQAKTVYPGNTQNIGNEVISTDGTTYLNCIYMTKKKDIDYIPYMDKCSTFYGPSYKLAESADYTYCCKQTQ